MSEIEPREYKYPTDDELERIRTWDIQKDGLKEFIDYVESLWRHPDWGFRLYKSKSHLSRKPAV